MTALVVLVGPDDEGDESAETQQAADGEERNDGKRDQNRAEEEQQRRRQQERDGGSRERQAGEGHHRGNPNENGDQPQHLAPVQRCILLRAEVQGVGPFLDRLRDRLRVRHVAVSLPPTNDQNPIPHSERASNRHRSLALSLCVANSTVTNRNGKCCRGRRLFERRMGGWLRHWSEAVYRMDGVGDHLRHAPP